MEFKLLDQKGEEKGKINLSDTIFSSEKMDWTVGEAIRMELSNARQSNAHTKTRGEVNSSKIKPWRQKGTGRARSGKANSPVWVGGGTVFGPRNKSNFTLKMPQKMYQSALRGLLSEKAKSNDILIVSDFSFNSGKTKDALEFLKNLGLSNKGKMTGKTLLVLPETDGSNGSDIKGIQQIKQSAHNIQGLTVVNTFGASPRALIHHKSIVLFESAAKIIEERLS